MNIGFLKLSFFNLIPVNVNLSFWNPVFQTQFFTFSLSNTNFQTQFFKLTFWPRGAAAVLKVWKLFFFLLFSGIYSSWFIMISISLLIMISNSWLLCLSKDSWRFMILSICDLLHKKSWIHATSWFLWYHEWLKLHFSNLGRPLFCQQAAQAPPSQPKLAIVAERAALGQLIDKKSGLPK